MLLRSVFVVILSLVVCAWPQFTPDTNTLALYHFDEGQGTVASDASPNHWNGTLTGCTWVTGRFGKALSFNGVSDFVTINHALPIRNISFELWIRSTDTMSSGCVMNMYSSYDQGFSVSFLEDSVHFYTSSLIGIQPRGALPNRQSWVYLAATIDNLDTIRLYINGNLVDKQPDPAMDRSWSSFYFGAFPYAGIMTNFFKGIIDEARISNCVRTPTELRNAFVLPQSILVSAEASGNQILLSFDQFTGTPLITSLNIDSIFPISGGHTWLSGFGSIDSAIWNPAGTKLLVTLSATFSPPTIAVGDSISYSLGSGKVALTGILNLLANLQNLRSQKNVNFFVELSGSIIRGSIPEQDRGNRVQLSISDVSGRVILSSEIALTSNGYFSYSLPKLTKGCFLVSLKTSRGFCRTTKLVGIN